MINFLDPKLLPKITRKPPCTDSYEAENLISKIFADKLRGFIAYPSTKPPVELEFEFLCNINISYIFLNTSVGNQRCSGVEIFAKHHCSNSRDNSNSNSEYVSIGRAIYDAQEVIFCNNRKYSKSAPPPRYKENVALYFFKSSSYKSFLNTTNLKIVIFKTEKSVPCLSAVEIWGVPGKGCSIKTVNTIRHLSRHHDEAISAKLKSVNNKISSEVCDEGNFVIPDEFKDDLTYELMTIPYTLPSGKTVDNTTLEKHITSEKSFGRKPGDPFTGIKFTPKLKPVLNVGLKSRIDMFLLENSHRSETFHLKRTLRVDNVNKRMKKDNLGGYNSNTSIGQRDNGSNYVDSTEDLDFLIKKAKSDSNFISFIHPSDSKQNICILCKNVSEYLYELPCEHCYCRKCLLDICKICMCMECKKYFVKGDVKKIDV